MSVSEVGNKNSTTVILYVESIGMLRFTQRVRLLCNPENENNWVTLPRISQQDMHGFGWILHITPLVPYAQCVPSAKLQWYSEPKLARCVKRTSDLQLRKEKWFLQISKHKIFQFLILKFCCSDFYFLFAFLFYIFLFAFCHTLVIIYPSAFTEFIFYV